MKHREYVARSRSPLLLVLALVAIGCGPAYRIIPSDASDHQPRLRDSTITRIAKCVEQYATQVAPGAHSLDFRIEVTQDGEFVSQKVTGPEGPSVHLEMQMCMRIALRAAAVPEEIFQTASVTPESRRYVGVADAAAPSVALRPIRVAASGVTIGVYVTVTAPNGITIWPFPPSDFRFVTTVPLRGTGPGGWQVAKVNLEFIRIVIPIKVITWYCPFTIQMPLRTEFMGNVDAFRAAILSAEVTNSVRQGMDDTLPQGIFCEKFIVDTRVAFKAKYPFLGASVIK